MPPPCSPFQVPPHVIRQAPRRDSPPPSPAPSHSSGSSSSRAPHRSRTTLACVYCRSRRIKCDGQSTCTSCTQRAKPCEYKHVAPGVNKAIKERKAMLKARKSLSPTAVHTSFLSVTATTAAGGAASLVGRHHPRSPRRTSGGVHTRAPTTSPTLPRYNPVTAGAPFYPSVLQTSPTFVEFQSARHPSFDGFSPVDPFFAAPISPASSASSVSLASASPAPTPSSGVWGNELQLQQQQYSEQAPPHAYILAAPPPLPSAPAASRQHYPPVYPSYPPLDSATPSFFNTPCSSESSIYSTSAPLADPTLVDYPRLSFSISSSGNTMGGASSLDPALGTPMTTSSYPSSPAGYLPLYHLGTAPSSRRHSTADGSLSALGFNSVGMTSNGSFSTSSQGFSSSQQQSGTGAATSAPSPVYITSFTYGSLGESLRPETPASSWYTEELLALTDDAGNGGSNSSFVRFEPATSSTYVDSDSYAIQL